MDKKQNGTFMSRGKRIVTTSTKLFVYQKNKLIGMAGVDDPKYFDFDVLYAWAMHKVGSNIEL